MKNRIRIGHLALTNREVEIVQSILSLVPGFAGKCTLLDSSEAHRGHIVVVNTDRPLALRWWKTIRKHNKTAIPLPLSNRNARNGNLPLKRPIQAKAFVAAIERLINATDVVDEEQVNASDVLNVLVVDDSLTLRQYMEYTIPKVDNGLINMKFASSGEDALRQVANGHFDLVFLDVVMPGIDGYKVCKAIKAEGLATVVMLTSKKSAFDKVRGAMSGCDGYIVKPPTLARLRGQIVKCKQNREDTRRAKTLAHGHSIHVSGAAYATSN